jgi:choline dehydrogenase-like flavoprotein
VGTVLSADVCVVGAGPAGLTVASELARRGRTVVVIERGAGPAPDEANESPARYETSGPVPADAWHPANGAGVGGSGRLWGDEIGLRSRPLEESDFRERAWVAGSGWPFEHAELDDDYRTAHGLLGLGPFEYTEEEAASPDGQGVGFRRLTFRQASPTVLAGFAQRTTASEQVHVLTYSEAGPPVADEGTGHVSAIEVNAGGRSFTVRAAVFVLALGGIENARSLLLSERRTGRPLGNEHGLVGRYFMEHPHLMVGALYPPADMASAVAASAAWSTDGDVTLVRLLSLTDSAIRERELLGATFELGRQPGRAIFAGRTATAWHGVRERFARAGVSRLVAVPAIDPLRHPTEAASYLLGRLLRRYGEEAVFLHAVAEQAPNPDSRVTLARATDDRGDPLARVEWLLTGGDMESLWDSVSLLGERTRNAGMGHVRPIFGRGETPPWMTGGGHHMGTTRMNRDPRHGVVDGNCRVHGTGNLYMTGASVFPTGGFANPTLTLVALASRLARHLDARL